MTKMKSLIALVAIALVTGLMSCDNQNADEIPLEELSVNDASRLRTAVASNTDSTAMDDWQEIAAADLPQEVQDYIAANHSDEEVEEAFLTDEGEYVVLLSNDLVLVFNSAGELTDTYELDDYDCDHEREEIDISALAIGIIEYLNENYPGETPEGAWVNGDGEIVIKMSNKVRLVFDADGNFIEERRKNRRGDEDDWDEIESEDLPQAIRDYVTNNHANDPIGEAFVNAETGEFLVILDSDTGLLFDADGNHLRTFDFDDDHRGDREDDEWDEIDPNDLPQAAKDYIAANYPDANIEEAGYNAEEEEYGVVLDNGKILIFDANGAFVEEFDDDDEEDYERVEPADLPQAIQDYVATNYANETIRRAVFSADDQEYIIFLSNRVVLIFDASGNFIEEDEHEDDDDDDDQDDRGGKRGKWDEIAASELPQAAADYIAANYGDRTIEEAYLNSKTGEYAVEFTDDTFVVFDADGNFLKEYSDDDDDDSDDDDDDDNG